MIHYHNGIDDFPHGAGPSEIGWYVYPNGIRPEPTGPFSSYEAAEQYLLFGVDEDA
jgi:hypothetical protein